MRLLFIRHGEPDYEKDSLTEKGFREAEHLADYLKDVRIDRCYVSPLGRAKDTAAPTLSKKQMQAVECDWLQEFPAKVIRPDKGYPINCWDFLPQNMLMSQRNLTRFWRGMAMSGRGTFTASAARTGIRSRFFVISRWSASCLGI